LILYDFSMVSEVPWQCFRLHGKIRTKPICSMAKQRRIANHMAKQVFTVTRIHRSFLFRASGVP
jgi:hypothetical protein